MNKQNPYQVFLATLRDKDRPGPMLPNGCISTKHKDYCAAANYMGNPKSSWGNPQNAPPGRWECLIYDT